jgi:enoyl-CoA hydratase
VTGSPGPSAATGRPVVLVERDGPLLTVTLNRPQVRNAVNRQVFELVAAAMGTLDADPQPRVGIVTGAGGTFCAGMDLKAFSQGERPSLDGAGFAGLTGRPPVTGRADRRQRAE